MLLEGKVAVVTGSGSGLGRAYAMALADYGAKVVVNARTASDVASVVEEIERNGGIAKGCVASVATMEGASSIINTATDNYGRIDILINNAGIHNSKVLAELTEQEFDDVIATHLKGTFACTRTAVPYMMEQKWGRIINMTSAALRGIIGRTAYAASKGGVLSMSMTWALELADYGITCNAIRAAASTRMSAPLIERAQKAAVERNEKPPTGADLGYFEPETAAPLVVFLASEQADWINGQLIGIDGPQLSLCTNAHRVRSATMPGGWTVENMLENFKAELGTPLEYFGARTPDGTKII